MAKGDPGVTTRGRRAAPRSKRAAVGRRRPGLVQLLTPAGERVESVHRPGRPSTASTSPTRSSAGSTATSCWSASSTPRRPRCSGRASWASGPACSARRRRRSAPAARCASRTWPSRPTASTASLYCRGIDPIMPLGLFRGVDHGGWDPNEYKFNLYTIVIGAQTLHATGYAMGVAMDGKIGGDDGEAVIAYFGDGATSQGDVNEAFVWASVFNAPVVFFCQNNQYAISEPLERQTRVPLYQRAAGFGFPGVRVDGNDVLACYAVTRDALDDARHGQGPTLIEAYTYRMGAHTTSDDPTRYRIASEVEAWQAKDPIARVRAYLDRQQIADDAFFDEVDEQAARARRCTCASGCWPCPTREPVTMFDHVYADARPSSTSSGRSSPRTSRRSRGARTDGHGDAHPRQGAQHRPAPGHGGRPQGPDHGRGHRQARRRLPDHRRPAEGLRRGAGHRHPAGRVRHHRHRGRPGHARLPAGLRDPVRRVRLPGVRPDRVAGGQDPLPLAGQAAACRSSSGSRSAAASARSSTTPSPPRRTSRTPPASRSSPARNPADAYWDDPAGDRLRRPDRLPRAQAAVLGEGRGRRWTRRAAAYPLSRPGWSRPGTDATVLAYGPMVRTALEAATAAAEEGRELEVVDLRTLSPLDLDAGLRVGPPHRPAASSSTRPRATWASARRSPPGSPRSASTRWRRRCCGSPATTPPTRRPGGGGVPARPRPGARRRRPLLRLVSGDDADQGVQRCPTSARA